MKLLASILTILILILLTAQGVSNEIPAMDSFQKLVLKMASITTKEAFDNTKQYQRQQVYRTKPGAETTRMPKVRAKKAIKKVRVYRIDDYRKMWKRLVEGDRDYRSYFGVAKQSSVDKIAMQLREQLPLKSYQRSMARLFIGFDAAVRVKL